jgi:ABC-2 type transport system ATP-binding protein
VSAQHTPPGAPESGSGSAPHTLNLAISAEGVLKVFGKETAVSEIKFGVPQGQILGMIGPSGCGKTTTLRLTIGIYNPTKGQVSLMGKAPQEFTPAERRQIGYMPQLFVLYPQLTVQENLEFAASMYGLPLFGRKKRMQEVLEFVDLDKHTKKLARNISGGMQRRLSLAATLIHNPQYIFLDEPTAGIDPVLRRRFWDHFVALRNQGRTLFVTTQYVGEAAYCDLVAVMAKGKMIMIEPPDQLRKKAFGGEIVNYGVRAPLKTEQIQAIQGMPYVMSQIKINSPTSLQMIVDEASTAMPQLMHWSEAHGIEIEIIEEFVPPFDDVFVEIVRQTSEPDPHAPATKPVTAKS